MSDARSHVPGLRLRFGMRGRKIVGYQQDGWHVVAYDRRGWGYVGQWIRRCQPSNEGP